MSPWRCEIGRRWPAGVVALLAGSALALAPDSPGTALLLASGLVTLLGALLPLERPPVPGGGWRSLARQLAAGLVVLVLALLPWLLPGNALAGASLPQRALAVVLLSSWGLLLLTLGEVLGRRWGAGATTFFGTLLPGLLLLTGPVSGQPLFPSAVPLALLLSPAVAAARALGGEPVHQPWIYELSPLGCLEFQYPPAWHTLLAFGGLTVALLVVARFTRERRR